MINDFLKKSSNSAKIVAISKNHPLESVLEAISYGVYIFGENRVQEAQEKFQNIKQNNPKIELHLTGPLQSNKVKIAIQMKNRHSVAVIIGNRNYKGMANVDFAERDANAMRKFIRDQLHYREGNIIDLKNKSKKTLELIKYIENLKSLDDQKKESKIINLKERKKFKRKINKGKKKNFFKKAK